ncbi:Gfo/Idh/MocA family protein [Janthinobacterium agaricidamnosum]|uniref:Oxidoreductase, NAD-binding Rossmann fold family protein n=1 Tax=Janthinobacterium agaricidamnosum NBRC 102515 = DSM 9628 TaxID=1349767 RepID=W0V0U3_9BURK|nr:Gfo/Idh/MocA family oxidoreductase [Janthinobacterium agaricidamnosum]CDG80953.1 oxidoreductase, NAD-binding Rossmann fold family protein [Janthinobacterium agaricidamnosum NBRC 102515 = DSM 9628]
MDNVIRWGILGTGKIAHALAQALADVPDARLVAVASRSSAGAERFGAEFGVARRHASYQALADDPEVDVIYIATPHTLHAENTLMCLNAGKHVLCEKAFTMNRREAQQVVALARQKNLFLMEAMWSRFLPGALEARRIIASGEIGAVRQLQADLGFVSTFGPQHRLLNPGLGGGALLDIGIYPLSMAAYFLGPVVQVQALGELGDTGVDEHAVFSLRHASGALSSCACTIRAQTPSELTITGTLGRIRIHNRFYQAQSLSVDIPGIATRSIATPYIGNGYAHEVIETMRCIRAGLIESPLMPHAESVELMGVLDTMRGQIGLTYQADLM